MTVRYVVVDDLTNEYGRGGPAGANAGPLFNDQLNDIGDTPVNFVAVAGGLTMTASNPIDIKIGGREIYEGPSRDFQRNLVQNRIDFNYPISNMVVKIRNWNL